MGFAAGATCAGIATILAGGVIIGTVAVVVSGGSASPLAVGAASVVVSMLAGSAIAATCTQFGGFVEASTTLNCHAKEVATAEEPPPVAIELKDLDTGPRQ